MSAFRLLLPLAALSLFSLASCGDSKKSGGPTKPIVMGDSSTIVTEADPALLEDIVPPMNIPEGSGETPAAAPVRDTTTTAAAPPEQPAQPVQQPAGAGYTVDFGEIKVTLLGGNIRNDNRSFNGAGSASLVADKGSYAGTGLQVAGGTVSKVQQRAQMAVMASRGGEVLLLSELGTGSTAWQQLKQQGGTWVMAPVAGVSFRNANNNSIRNAVQRAAQRKRLSRSAQQEWLNAVKSTGSVGQAPVEAVLRSITWRIDGKDSRGKAFSKEVRVDVPM